MQPATSTSKYFPYFNIIPATLPGPLLVSAEWLVVSSLYLPLKSFLSLLVFADYAENAVTSCKPFSLFFVIFLNRTDEMMCKRAKSESLYKSVLFTLQFFIFYPVLLRADCKMRVFLSIFLK